MAERKTLLIPSLLDDWFPLLQYAFTSEEWEPVLLTEDDPHLAELGLKKLDELRGCDAHFSVILSEEDTKLYNRLGIHVSCEPKYEIKKLYHK